MSPDYLENFSVFNFIFFIALAGLTAYYAKFKGRNAVAWFLITLLLSVIAPIILMFLPRLGPDGRRIDEEGEVIIPVTPPAPAVNEPEENTSDTLINNRIEGEDKLWYYLDHAHQQMGPVSVIALRELWHTGRLDLGTYVWCEGMVDWKKVDELPDLKTILNKSYVM